MPRTRTLAKEQKQQEEVIITREPGDEPEREPLPPQRGWKHDNAAGVERLFYSDRENEVYEAWFKFRDGDPGPKVRGFLHEKGYTWKPNAPAGGRWPEVKGAWKIPTNFETLSRDRLNHERNFAKVVEMMYAEKGVEPLEHSEGIAF